MHQPSSAMPSPMSTRKNSAGLLEGFELLLQLRVVRRAVAPVVAGQADQFVVGGVSKVEYRWTAHSPRADL